MSRLRSFGRTTGRAARCTARATGNGVRWGVRQTLAGGRGIPDVPIPPAGKDVELPGRGTTCVVDVPGPTPDAPTLLLLHGIATTGGLTWFSVISHLCERYRVVTFDQRWHGRGIASDQFSIEDCADDADAVLEALGIERAVVLGYSMGGATAQMLWRRHPERVAGLVLGSTAARWHSNIPERAFFTLLAALDFGIHASASKRVSGLRDSLPSVPPEDLTDLRDWAVAELKSTSPWSLPVALAALGRFDSRPWIGDIDVPVAVVITARDRAIPTERQRELASLLPNARVSEAPGGHTSLVWDLERWRPLFLEAVDHVVQEAGNPLVE